MDLNDILSPPKAVKVKKTNMEGGGWGPVIQLNLKSPYIFNFTHDF